jgi:hypothetical protein
MRLQRGVSAREGQKTPAIRPRSTDRWLHLSTGGARVSPYRFLANPWYPETRIIQDLLKTALENRFGRIDPISTIWSGSDRITDVIGYIHPAFPEVRKKCRFRILL